MDERKGAAIGLCISASATLQACLKKERGCVVLDQPQQATQFRRMGVFSACCGWSSTQPRSGVFRQVFRRLFTWVCALVACGCCAGNVLADSSSADAAITTLKSGWDKPARTYKPHTRWWWPGNALTKTDITWQLEQMVGQGIGETDLPTSGLLGPVRICFKRPA